MFERRIVGLTVLGFTVSLVFSQLNTCRLTVVVKYRSPEIIALENKEELRKADDTGLNHSVSRCENNCFVRLM